MTRTEAIRLLQGVLAYQASEGQRLIWFTDENVKRIIDVLKYDTECENCAIAIEDRQRIVRCMDCRYATMTADGELCKYCEMDTDDNGDPREVYHSAKFYCANGERKEG